MSAWDALLALSFVIRVYFVSRKKRSRKNERKNNTCMYKFMVEPPFKANISYTWSDHSWSYTCLVIPVSLCSCFQKFFFWIFSSLNLHERICSSPMNGRGNLIQALMDASLSPELAKTSQTFKKNILLCFFPKWRLSPVITKRQIIASKTQVLTLFLISCY